MRTRAFTALAAALAAAALIGCADDNAGPGSDEQLPEARGIVDGRPAVKADSAEEAGRLCDAAKLDWPYGDARAVTFDVPGDADDVVCRAPDS
jgi:hypothetical protein